MRISQVIRNSYEDLKNNGEIATSKKWQAIDTPDDLWEIINTYIQMDMPDTI
jgi:hypothetical protein